MEDLSKLKESISKLIESIDSVLVEEFIADVGVERFKGHYQLFNEFEDQLLNLKKKAKEVKDHI